MAENNLDIWHFAHGTGAGMASVFGWEALRHALDSGALFGVYGALTICLMHAVHWHHRRLHRRPRDKKGRYLAQSRPH